MQPIKRLHPLRRIDIADEESGEIDAGHSRHDMRDTDETAHYTVAIESVREIGVPWPADDIALVPIGARAAVQHRPQPVAIELRVGGRCSLAEELPELRISGEGADARELQLQKRKVRFIGIDGIDLGRL